jgi:hypothetical protein
LKREARNMPKRNRYSINAKQPASTISEGKKLTYRKRLTGKQEKFCQIVASKYYFGDCSLFSAALEAGYSRTSASTASYKLIDPKKNPTIVDRIKELRAEHAKKYGVTYEKHIRDLQTIRDAALGDKAYSAAVSAEYRRGQAQGDIYINKLEVRKGNIDSMSKEEVLEELEKLGVRTVATLEGESSRVDDAEDADYEEIEDEAGEPVLDKSAEADSSELDAFLESRQD